jgi:prophage regulatory protein
LGGFFMGVSAMENTESQAVKMLKIGQVVERTALSKAAIYAKLNPKDPRHDASFPRSIRLTGAAVAWVESEIDAWLRARIAASRAKHTSKEKTA